MSNLEKIQILLEHDNIKNSMENHAITLKFLKFLERRIGTMQENSIKRVCLEHETKRKNHKNKVNLLYDGYKGSLNV